MIFEINCGHCVKGFDTGAVGCGFKEQDLTRNVGNLVMAKLKAMGHLVINCTVDNANSVSEALNAICIKANALKADYFISIHFNASNGQGHGTEIFTYGAKETKEGTNILKNITALGYTNRGVKDGTKLAVIKNTKAPAMLIECCFVDNHEDMKIFDAEKMADAIVNGLVGVTAAPKTVIANNAATQRPTYQEQYVREFQKFYNDVTKTTTPLIVDGEYGPSTEKAYGLLSKLIKGGY